MPKEILESDSTSNLRRAKVQRSVAGHLLGACIAIGADDLSFVDSNTEWLMIEKKKIDDGLIIEIRGDDA